MLLFSSSHGMTGDESPNERKEMTNSLAHYYCVDGQFWDKKGLKTVFEKIECD